MKKVLLVFVLVFCMGLLSMSVATVDARGNCFSGYAYRDAGTAHNYVEFRVIMSALDWHVEYPWYVFPIDLWAYPSGGIAKAGIRFTDYNPPYSPSVYKLCTGK